MLRGYVDLSSRVKLTLRGSDRERYLNGQVTNDVRKAAASAALYACVTNAKGKLEGDLFISRTPDGEAFWMDGPPELAESLPVRLERYLIADDAELTDVSGEFELVHVLGADPELPGLWKRRANRYGQEGLDLIAPAGTGLAETIDLDPLLETALTEMRIRHGIAQWGAELGPEVLPQEARLEDRAVDFHKGCYIGQEVISRIKSVGRVNRRLYIFQAAEASAPLEPGMDVMEGDDKVLGRFTSCAFSPTLGRWIGMGIVKSRELESELPVHLFARSSKNDLSTLLEFRETPF